VAATLLAAAVAPLMVLAARLRTPRAALAPTVKVRVAPELIP
jgi:hypothetical protein